MIVRPAKATDVPSVLPMVTAMCHWHESLDRSRYGLLPEPARSYEHWLERRATDPRSVFLVAEGEKAVDEPRALAGYLVATVEPEIPIYRVEEYGFIHDLWIEPEHRLAGLGRELIREAVKRFRQIGVAQIRLDVVVGNGLARQLFESCGFRPATIQMLMDLESRSEQ